MRTYAFRIQCKLAGGDLGTSEREFSLALQAPTPPISVTLPERKPPSEDQRLILWCGGFTSEDAARAEGQRVKTAVMLAGVLLCFGIDVGTDQVISPVAQRMDGQPDERLPVMVWPHPSAPGAASPTRHGLHDERRHQLSGGVLPGLHHRARVGVWHGACGVSRRLDRHHRVGFWGHPPPFD